MSRAKQCYFFSLYGALGGLVASLLHQSLLLDTLSGRLPPNSRYFYLGLLGGLVGMATGFFPIFSQGRGNYSISVAFRTGVIGALLGGLGGVIALPLAEWLHINLGGGFKGRVLSWMLLGFAVGLAEKITGGAQAWRGLAGGAVGGAVAGGVMEILLRYQATYAGSGIIALMAVGFFIALFISFFVNFLAEAWLEGQPGSKVNGQVFHLGKFREPAVAVLGSGMEKVFIWIPGAQPRHAEMTLLATGARLRHVAESGETLINGNAIKEQMLRDGDLIQIGPVRLKYRERRALSRLDAAHRELSKAASA